MGHELICFANAGVIRHHNDHFFCCIQTTPLCPAPVSWHLSEDIPCDGV